MVRRFACGAVGLVLGGCLWAAPARGQVWVDADQLGGRAPEWVDPHYYRPTPQPEPTVVRTSSLWVEPVYRTTCRRVWHEAVTQTVSERIWVEGRSETRPVHYVDPCGCDKMRYEQVYVSGHWECIQRQVELRPGYWESAQVRELVTPGHWETVAYRD